MEEEEKSSPSTLNEKLFVTCLNCDSKNKLEKPIEKYFDLFINNNFNHISISSHRVSQAKNKLISNLEQLFNATDLSPITFGVILLLNLCA